ncbi:MAG: HD-GYP domain-containing protein [Nitrospirota bacterium]
MKPLGIVGKFSIYSFIAVVLIGTILAWAVSEIMRKVMIEDSAKTAAFAVHTVIEKILPPIDRPLTVSKYEEIDRFVKEHILSERIARVMIWNRDGYIIYSDNPVITGKKHAVKDDLKKALLGDIHAEVSRLDTEENRDLSTRFKRLLEIYVPIKDKDTGKITGAYEVYESLKPIEEHSNKLRVTTWLILSGGFAGLYLVLFGIVKGASNTIIRQNISLIELNIRLEESLKQLKETYIGTIRALSAAVDAKDRYTAGHSSRVAEYALMVGRGLDFDEERLQRLEQAGLFHDIGKIGTPESVLTKDGKLSDEEFDIMKGHPVISADIISHIGFLQDVVPIIYHHHERYDGKGYPAGLKGEEIPLESRILAGADAYDAMTSERHYRKALTHEEAVKELSKLSGIQFDANIVRVLISAIEREDRDKGR